MPMYLSPHCHPYAVESQIVKVNRQGAASDMRSTLETSGQAA